MKPVSKGKWTMIQNPATPAKKYYPLKFGIGRIWITRTVKGVPIIINALRIISNI